MTPPSLDMQGIHQWAKK